MGAKHSKEHKRQVLEHEVLSYLQSKSEKDYKKNPSKAFSSVRSHGYSNLESFIKKINLAEQIALNPNHPTAQPGFRYVVKQNPADKGSIVEININNGSATLKMDRKGNHVNLPCVSENRIHREFLFDDLEPEKVYFQSFLMTPFSHSILNTSDRKNAKHLETRTPEHANLKLQSSTKEVETQEQPAETNSVNLPSQRYIPESNVETTDTHLSFLLEVDVDVVNKHKVLTDEPSPSNLVVSSIENHKDKTLVIDRPVEGEDKINAEHESLSGIIVMIKESSLPTQEITLVDMDNQNCKEIVSSSSNVSDTDKKNFQLSMELETESLEASSVDNQPDLQTNDVEMAKISDLDTIDSCNIETNSLPNEDLPVVNHVAAKNATAKNARRGRKRSLSTDKKTRKQKSKKKLQLHSPLELQDHISNVSDEVNPFVGTSKGISGYNNSCYMDSLLVSMFYCTAMFNGLLLQKAGDSTEVSLCRQILRESIVKPLRKKYYCTSESAMKLRSHLGKLDGDILGSFMDVEQLLYLLFDDALKEQEFIKYSDGGEDFMHQTSIDNSDNYKSITVQTNLETSMRLNGNLKFQSVPNPGLIVGLPRSNGKFVQYSTVIPNPELDIRGIIEPVLCSNCQEEANWEKIDRKNVDPPYPCCDTCSEKVVLNNIDNTCVVASRQKMRLTAIICVRASHFTAFVRNTLGRSEWLFFDSMAGRGPEVKIINNLDEWLNNVCGLHSDNRNTFIQNGNDDSSYLKQRTCRDGHMCIYEQVCYPGL